MTQHFLAFGFSGPEMLIVLALIVLLFGGAKLPGLARSLGRSLTEFKRGKQEGADLLKAATQEAEKADETPADSKSQESS